MPGEHLVLIEDCSEAALNMEECAEKFYSDFNQLVTSAMGGQGRLMQVSSQFPGSRIRFLGDGDILKFVLFRVHRKIEDKDRRLLTRLANGVARGMGATLPLPKIRYPLDFDQVFVQVDCVTQPKFDFDNIRAREMPSGLKYIDFDFEKLVTVNVREALNKSLEEAMTSADAQEEEDTRQSAGVIRGVKISNLIYDDASAAIARNFFGPDMPERNANSRKNYTCINPEHDDRNPSMTVGLRPMFWRSSTKICSRLSPGVEAALEDLYRGGKPASVTRVSDNAAKAKGNIILMYVCTAKCYACNFSSMLTNDQIKQIK